MIISHQHKFVCLNPPKTGSGFRENIFNKYIDDGFIPHQTSYTLRHYTASQAECYFYSKNLNPDSYFWFTFARNPWSRAVSYYNMMINQNCKDQSCIEKFLNLKSFNNWINSLKSTYKTQNMYLSRSNTPIDFIGSLESINEDLNFISSHLNLSISTPNYKSHETSYHRDISKLWTNKSIDIIKNLEGTVISLKNYTFNYNM